MMNIIQRIIERLQEKGIQTRPVWGLIHEQKPYQGEIAYQIEKAVYYSQRVLNIPCSTQITEDEIHYAAEGVYFERFYPADSIFYNDVNHSAACIQYRQNVNLGIMRTIEEMAI